MDPGQTQCNPPTGIGGLSSLAGREKYWGELTADEKVERLRKELKRQCTKNEELTATIYTLKNKFANHAHDDFWRVVVPESLVKDDKGGTGYNRLTDKGGEEVYI